MNERTRRRVRVFSLVSGGFAFAMAAVLIAVGPRTGFAWFLFVGTGTSLILNLRTPPKA